MMATQEKALTSLYKRTPSETKENRIWVGLDWPVCWLCEWKISQRDAEYIRTFCPVPGRVMAVQEPGFDAPTPEGSGYCFRHYRESFLPSPEDLGEYKRSNLQEFIPAETLERIAEEEDAEKAIQLAEEAALPLNNYRRWRDWDAQVNSPWVPYWDELSHRETVGEGSVIGVHVLGFADGFHHSALRTLWKTHGMYLQAHGKGMLASPLPLP